MGVQKFVPRDGKAKGSKSPFTLKEKVEALAAVKLRHEDAKTALEPLYKKYKRPMPKYPKQAMSAWAGMLERLVCAGNKEAIDLARNAGFTLPESAGPSGKPGKGCAKTSR